MMVDILLYSHKPLRSTGARASNYIMARDKPGGGRHETKTMRRTRPPSNYNYVVKVVNDPLGIGAFDAGTVFSVGELDCMLIYGSFTPGTSLIVRGELCFVHPNGNGGQCVKRFKPTSVSS